MRYRNWMVCQLLIIISTPLQGLITIPTCKDGLDNKAFQVESFYFWSPCNYKYQPDARTFCSNAGGWLNEPKTEGIVEYMKNSAGLGMANYFQGLEKKGDNWTWLQGGEWDGKNPTRNGVNNGGDACSVHRNLKWQQHTCNMTARRYICQFQSCSGNGDCNQYEDCVTRGNDDTMKFCTCKGGYYGTRCTDQYCSPECPYRRICIAEKNSNYSCQCFDGFYGDTCSNDYCAEHGNPCQNNGTCEGNRTEPYYECNCKPGFYGLNCSETFCSANPDTCKYNGTCHSEFGIPSYNCSCDLGYYGRNCTETFCSANPDTCKYNGTCHSEFGIPGYNCSCDLGYYGRNCTDDYCAEHENPCQNNRTCKGHRTEPYYQCNCKPGFYGLNCSETYCSANPDTCKYNGTCHSELGIPGYNCSCHLGYYGMNCTKGYCEEYENPCENGANCVNNHTDDLYKCDCRPEYDGRNCSNLRYYSNGDCMYYINANNTVNYDIALKKCQSNRGALAMVKNESIHEFIVATIEEMYNGTAVEVWIGGEQNGTWKWLDGDTIVINESGYTNWAEEEPQANGESILLKKKSNVYQWYGEQRSYEHGGIICEKHVDGRKPCLTNDPCANGNCTEIGCQSICVCDQGYFQRYCDKDLISISSPHYIVGVANENLTIQLNITTFDGPLSVDVLLNGSIADTIDDVRNGTVDYTLVGVRKSDDGSIYTFTASSHGGGYHRNTSTHISVHARAFVNVSETTIYAPQSGYKGCNKTLTCIVGGIPAPTEYGWYRNGVKLNESTDFGVSQILKGTSSTLYVQNAILSDQGQYMCYAVNTVAGEKNVSYSEMNVTLSVYNAPVVVTPSRKSCSGRPEIEVNWVADNATYNVNHTFWVTELNGTVSYNSNKTATNGNQVTFDGLEPYTLYKIHVEVCPESACCIGKLNRTVSFTTVEGLPGDVSSEIEGNGTAICEVFLTVPGTQGDQLDGYNISWTAEIKDKLSYEVDNIYGQDFVDAPNLNYSLKTKPNKIYRVQVSAKSCAGNGNFSNSTGECWTPKAGPDDVPPAIIETASNGLRQETRQVNISMVTDESNGAISCLFVVLYKNNDGELPRSLIDLQQLSSNAFSEKVEGGYIAEAIERRNLVIGTEVPVTLGNGHATSCDVSETMAISQRNTPHSTVIKAQNVALDYRGVQYRVLSVTTTPVSDGEVIVTYSHNYVNLEDLPSFIQGQNLSWVTACVLVPFILIATLVFVWIRHNRNPTKQAYEPNTNFPPMQLEELVNDETYVNMDVTVIPLKRLKEHYVQMQADECMLFKEQFTKLKQEAKRTAPPYTYASSDEVSVKNRYKNILPYDNNRVYLKGEGADGYINASYIKGSKKMFIATQGPLPNTSADFWRMIVEQGCRIIFMLAKCEENGRPKCERYWPEAQKEVIYGPYRIRNIEEKTCGRIVTTLLKVQVPDQREITVTHNQYTSWPDHGVPQTTTAFLRLHKQMITQFNATDKDSPIVVHCSAGVGRTGTFIGFDLLLGESDREMNAYKCVMQMRQQRVDMVQTKEQYQLLHRLMLEQCHFKETDSEPTEWLKRNCNDDAIEELQLLNEFDAMNSKRRDNSSANTSNAIIVRQPEDTEWVKIDATFVEAYQENMHFIASEGPSNSTVEYFLRTLWDNQVDEIIMLNNPLVENDQGQFCEYWPAQPNSPVTYNSITITLRSSNKAREMMERVLCLERRNQQPRTIKHFQFLKWEIDQDPEHCELLIDFINRTVNHSNTKEATVLVHCTDGLKRTGVFIAVANIIARLEMEDRIDVVRTVKDLKDIRPGIVTSLCDYKCCYNLAKQFLTPQSTYANEAFQPDTTGNDDADAIYHNLGSSQKHP